MSIKKDLNSSNQYAPVRKRLFSLIMDYLIIATYALSLFGITVFVSSVLMKEIPQLNELQGNLISFFSLVFPAYLYFAISEAGIKHASFGKRISGIYVISTSGSLKIWQIVVRNILKLLPWQIAHMAILNVVANNSEPTFFFYSCIVFVYAFSLLNIVFMIFRKDRRALHDLMSHTSIVKR